MSTKKTDSEEAGTRKFRLRSDPRGFQRIVEEKVIELPAGEEPPAGAERVPHNTRVHDWEEVREG